MPLLQQLTQTLSSLITQLQGQSSAGASTGAAALGGGPGVGQAPGQGAGSGCGCGGGSGAVAGVEQVGQAPPQSVEQKPSAEQPQGAKGAPEPKGAKGAPEAKGASGGGSASGARLVEELRKHLGTKYVWGGEAPGGFDCSGLMQYVAKQLGITIPRTAADQAKAGKEVGKGELQPGDMVFFNTSGSRVSHVGMYIGDGKMIHAPKTGDVVKVSSIEDSYYASKYVTARRMA